MEDLKFSVGVHNWYSDVLKDLSESLQPRIGVYLSEKQVVDVMNEFAKKLIKHATYVNGPVYIDPYNHDINYQEEKK